MQFRVTLLEAASLDRGGLEDNANEYPHPFTACDAAGQHQQWRLVLQAWTWRVVKPRVPGIPGDSGFIFYAKIAK
jgi:hypothetical protein